MAEIINLNQFRKAKQKKQRRGEAAANRVRHGRTSDTVKVEKAERDDRQREHDGNRLDPDENGNEPA